MKNKFLLINENEKKEILDKHNFLKTVLETKRKNTKLIIEQSENPLVGDEIIKFAISSSGCPMLKNAPKGEVELKYLPSSGRNAIRVEPKTNNIGIVKVGEQALLFSDMTIKIRDVNGVVRTTKWGCKELTAKQNVKQSQSLKQLKDEGWGTYDELKDKIKWRDQTTYDTYPTLVNGIQLYKPKSFGNVVAGGVTEKEKGIIDYFKATYGYKLEDEIPSQELVRGEWDEVTIPNAEKIFGGKQPVKFYQKRTAGKEGIQSAIQTAKNVLQSQDVSKGDCSDLISAYWQNYQEATTSTPDTQLKAAVQRCYNKYYNRGWGALRDDDKYNGILKAMAEGGYACADSEDKYKCAERKKNRGEKMGPVPESPWRINVNR